MRKKVNEEIKAIIKEGGYSCSVEEFLNNVNWEYISQYKNLSENFILLVDIGLIFIVLDNFWSTKKGINSSLNILANVFDLLSQSIEDDLGETGGIDGS